MYKRNKKQHSPVYSDYPIISPYVWMFRLDDGHLLDEPYCISAMSVPAVNKNGAGKDVPQDEVMVGGVQSLLAAAALHGHKILVLGAWRCGSFGNDTEKVAEYFRTVLFGEGWRKLFNWVVFAIPDADKRLDFAKVLFTEQDGLFDDGHDQVVLASQAAQPRLIEAVSDFPACNYFKCVDKNKLGCCQGVIADETPYVAELWTDEGIKMLSVMLPEALIDKDAPPSPTLAATTDPNAPEMRGCKYHDNGALHIGMVEGGWATGNEIVNQYVIFLEEAGLLEFTTVVHNGSTPYYTDVVGYDFARVKVILEQPDGYVDATTPPRFRNSPKQPHGNGKTARFPGTVDAKPSSPDD